MAFQPNLKRAERIVYVLIGLVLIAVGFFGPGAEWMRVALPILGGIAVVEGAIGY